jgi:hypothetical protein
MIHDGQVCPLDSSVLVDLSGSYNAEGINLSVCYCPRCDVAVVYLALVTAATPPAVLQWRRRQGLLELQDMVCLHTGTGTMGVHPACFLIDGQGYSPPRPGIPPETTPPILHILPLIAHQLASARDYSVRLLQQSDDRRLIDLWNDSRNRHLGLPPLG